MPHTGSQLLDAMPEAEFERLRPHLERRSFNLGDVLDVEDEPIQHEHFPLTGMIVSMVNVMEDGGMVEVLVAGDEAITGHDIFGLPQSPWRVVVQVAGDALVCSRSVLLEQMAHMPVLADLLRRQTNFVLRFSAQSVGCNRFHEVTERAARWLLLVHDRAGGDTLRLTQEFIAQMLGVHRPSVSVAMGTLQRAGLIERISRGTIVIRDRRGLEEAACECYRRVRDYESLLAQPGAGQAQRA